MNIVVAFLLFAIGVYQLITFGALVQKNARRPQVIAINGAITALVCFVVLYGGVYLLEATK